MRKIKTNHMRLIALLLILCAAVAATAALVAVLQTRHSSDHESTLAQIQTIEAILLQAQAKLEEARLALQGESPAPGPSMTTKYGSLGSIAMGVQNWTGSFGRPNAPAELQPSVLMYEPVVRGEEEMRVYCCRTSQGVVDRAQLLPITNGLTGYFLVSKPQDVHARLHPKASRPCSCIFNGRSTFTSPNKGEGAHCVLHWTDASYT